MVWQAWLVSSLRSPSGLQLLHLGMAVILFVAAGACDVESVDGADSTQLAITATELALAWNDNANDEDGGRIERRTGMVGDFAFLRSVPANTSSYVDGVLEPDQTYCYRVQAFNAAGSSAFTSEECGTTMAPDGGSSGAPD